MEAPLSPLARQIISAGSYTALVAPSGTPDLARKLLAQVTPDQLLAVPVRSYPHAFAMLAGLWLWHDALTESHEIAQKSPEKLHLSAPFPHQTPSKMSHLVQPVETVENDKGANRQQLRDATDTLAFWHAIMHRREGDFSNAKYWYARCADHRAARLISAMSKDTVGRKTADNAILQIVGGEYNPDALVDLVAELDGMEHGPRYEAAARIQQLEWEALFQYCAYEAAGAQGGMI